MIRFILFITLILSLGSAQTTTNPDISIIGDLVFSTDGDKTDFSNSGLEIAAQGYVNPYARADVFLHLHDENSVLELEEAVLSIERGLPLNLGLRTGKFRPDFSKINPEHMHTYAYILPSTVAQSILGEEMWSSFGIETQALLPLPWYSNFSLGFFQHGISEHHHHDELHPDETNKNHHEAEDSETKEPGKTLSSRFSHFFDLNNNSHLEAGISAYRELKDRERSIFGADIKFKWRPDTYRSITLQADLFQVEDKHESLQAGYTWINIQFSRIWNVGLIADYSSNFKEARYSSIGLFAGFSPVEESSVFRLRVHQNWHGDEDPEWSVTGQIIWSLGPHKPHQF